MKDKIITNKTFPQLLGLTALLIALCAAFFSVYGIGSLFAGASFSAMVMASSLEIGKLIATTFLYRYWKKTVGLVKVYLTTAVISLMVITSAGIFGFLSAAYQKSSLAFKLNQEKIITVESSKGYYSNQIGYAVERIKVLNDTRKTQESRLSDALKDPMLTRNPIQLKQIQDQTVKLIEQADVDIRNENDKIESARSKMQSIDEQVNQMKISGIEKKDIQTFKFLADALGVNLDTVAKWFIISLIFVFDPLAIALILAYNVVVYKKEDEKKYNEPVVEEPVLYIPKEQIKYKEPVVESTNSIEPEKLEIAGLSEEKKKTQLIIVNNEPNVELPIIKDTIDEQISTSSVCMNILPITSSNTTTTNQICPEMEAYYKGMFKK